MMDLERIAEINDVINEFVWGTPTIVLVMAVGLFLTVRLGFIQFTHMGYLFNRTILKAFRKKDTGERVPGEISSFQAAMMSVSAIVGSGNIAGVATAIIAGGPGALFWMVIAAFIGMATKYAEVALGIRYRQMRPDGNIDGGPMYYIASGLNMKWLGMLISICIIFYAIVISAIIDTNTMAATLDESFGISPYASGVVITVLTAICIFGGAKRVGRVCGILAPFMGGAYIISGILIIVLHASDVPAAIALIVRGAFEPEAVTGGAVGSVFIAMRYGFARGVFSNEAGVGSAAMVHCNASVKHPMEQAVWGPVEVFLDTVLVCTVSGLAIILSGLWQGGELSGARLTMGAFDMMLPGSIGSYICLGAVLLFGYSCLITFNTYVERAAAFVFGDSHTTRIIVRVIWTGLVMIGAISGENIVWDIADTTNGLVIIPNLIALILLSGELVRLKDEYTNKDIDDYKNGK